jgi:polysaccharide biosynthesis protein PelA
MHRWTGPRLVSLLLLLPALLWGAPKERMLVALYDSSEAEQADDNPIHQLAEMPLNWLGFYLRYHDIAQGVPPDDLVDQAHGIITWFGSDEMANPTQYLAWLEGKLQEGKKVIILGNLGAFVDSTTKSPVPNDQINAVFNALGLRWLGNWSDQPTQLTISFLSDEMMNFEADVASNLTDYEQFQSIGEQNQVYLTLNRTDLTDGKSDLVMTTPRGGFIFSHYAARFDRRREQHRWYINPFLFFARALDIDGWPQLDTTTLFGRRIFFAHINGDGFLEGSEIADNATAGQVILQQIVKKHPLPVTASFVTCEVDPYFIGTAASQELAKQIYQESNVEPATHSFSNPYVWREKITANPIKGYSKPIHYSFARDEITRHGEANAAEVTVDTDLFLKTETQGSTQFANSYLAPESKKIALFLWTGDYKPQEQGITDLNIPNMNGGLSRMDETRPSYTNLAPLARQIGEAVQPYAPISSDSIFTNGWTDPLYGMIYVLDTFKQTEKPTLIDNIPRRVKPINIYYHFYSGVHATSLGALQKVYESVLNQEMIPVTASYYAQMVLDFFTAKIEPAGGEHSGWIITQYGLCRTLRFDHPELYPDLSHSIGVLGYLDWGNYRYVHLAEGGQATLILSSAPPTEPYLVFAEAVPMQLQLSANSISFSTYGWRPERVQFANMPRNRGYTAIIKQSSGPPSTVTAETDGQGILDLTLPLQGSASVMIQPS